MPLSTWKDWRGGQQTAGVDVRSQDTGGSETSQPILRTVRLQGPPAFTRDLSRSSHDVGFVNAPPLAATA